MPKRVKLKATALRSPERSDAEQIRDMQRQPLSTDKTKPFHEQRIGAGQVGAGFMGESAESKIYLPPEDVSPLIQKTSKLFDPIEDKRHQLHKLEKEKRQLEVKLRMADKYLAELDRYEKWSESPSFALERNDCTRMHKLIQAFSDDQVRFIDTGEYANRIVPEAIRTAQSIVVNHDWAAALGEDHEAYSETLDFRLPYPATAFEFRINGMTCLVVMLEISKDGADSLLMNSFMELSPQLWATLTNNDVSFGTEPSHRFMWRQIRAICIALESEVAVREVVRAPAALNAKRAKNGKPLLPDHTVVNLAKRHRIASRTDNVTGRRVRLHYRRGHWRNYENHKTWIKWMLVGNPDLGFLAKHYTA